MEKEENYLTSYAASVINISEKKTSRMQLNLLQNKYMILTLAINLRD